MRNHLLILLLAILVLFSCNRNSESIEEERQSEPCGEAVQLAANFSTADSDPFTVADASIDGDCLTVKLGLSSACTDPAEIDLLGVASIAAVYPPIYNLKVGLKYGTGCAMPGQRIFMFDLSSIRINDKGKFSIQLDGYSKSLEYSY